MSPVSPDIDPAAVWVSAEAICKRYNGVNPRWIKRRQAQHGFPTEVRFGGRDRFWKLSDVIAWEKAQAEAGVAYVMPASRAAA